MRSLSELTMRSLTSEEIAKLATRRGVRRIAVVNFLGTMGPSRENAFRNLVLDSRLYSWNVATMQAITAGIVLASRTSP